MVIIDVLQLFIRVSALGHALNPREPPVAAVDPFQAVNSAQAANIINARVNVPYTDAVNTSLPILMR